MSERVSTGEISDILSKEFATDMLPERVGVWTKSIGKSIPGAPNEDVAGGKGRSPEKAKDVLLNIGKKFKTVLQLPENEVLEFSGHTDSAHSGSTRAKAKFTA
jgi:translation initiation factor 4E